MNQDEIRRKQNEQRDAFKFALSDFAAKLNFIDDNTPSGGEVPPSWWLQLSSLRRQVLNVAADLS